MKLSQQSFNQDLRRGTMLSGIIDELGTLVAQIKNLNVYLLIKMATLTFHDGIGKKGGTTIK